MRHAASVGSDAGCRTSPHPPSARRRTYQVPQDDSFRASTRQPQTASCPRGSMVVPQDNLASAASGATRVQPAPGTYRLAQTLVWVNGEEPDSYRSQTTSISPPLLRAMEGLSKRDPASGRCSSAPQPP